MPLVNLVLNKTSSGGGGANPCCPFTFGSVMGQENVFKETSPGSLTRDISGALSARIVWATSVDATSRVEYGVGETVVYGNDTGVVASGNTYHEVIIPNLALDTLYHFRVISTSTECDGDGETLTSEAFWFNTGGELVVSSNQIEFQITNEILTIGQSAAVTALDDLDIVPDLNPVAATTRDPISLTEATSIPTVGVTSTKTAGATMIYTGTPSTSVV